MMGVIRVTRGNVSWDYVRSHTVTKKCPPDRGLGGGKSRYVGARSLLRGG